MNYYLVLPPYIKLNRNVKVYFKNSSLEENTHIKGHLVLSWNGETWCLMVKKRIYLLEWQFFFYLQAQNRPYPGRMPVSMQQNSAMWMIPARSSVPPSYQPVTHQLMSSVTVVSVTRPSATSWRRFLQTWPTHSSSAPAKISHALSGDVRPQCQAAHSIALNFLTVWKFGETVDKTQCAGNSTRSTISYCYIYIGNKIWATDLFFSLVFIGGVNIYRGWK